MSISIGRFESDLLRKYSIDENVFFNDSNIKLDEPFIVPTERLIAYAHEFKIPLEQLHNQKK